jgi:hypothetical protein
LDKSDATYVDNIHTDAILGIQQSIGLFYFGFFKLDFLFKEISKTKGTKIFFLMEVNDSFLFKITKKMLLIV